MIVKIQTSRRIVSSSTEGGPDQLEDEGQAQHEGRVSLPRVVVQVDHAEAPEEGVADPGERDAEEDDDEAEPVHDPGAVLSTRALQRVLVHARPAQTLHTPGRCRY